VKARLLLLLALAGPAYAEDRTGALIDALTTPVPDAAALVQALEAQGFAVIAPTLTGPAALPAGVTDPSYFHLAADVSDLAQPAPLILLQCSRVGLGLLPHLPNGASAEGLFALPIVPVLQWADTIDFLPGAGSQLHCLADHLPVTPKLDPVALPDRSSVLAAITARFASVATEPLLESVNPGWVLYPPGADPGDDPGADPGADPGPAPAPPPPDGPVVITAATLDPDTPGQSLALRYEHRGADALHSLQIILHQPPQD
jgi:hypothetical protein